MDTNGGGRHDGWPRYDTSESGDEDAAWAELSVDDGGGWLTCVTSGSILIVVDVVLAGSSAGGG